MIGLRFNSLARSLDASCHSLVNVFGGGAAKKKKKRKDCQRTKKKLMYGFSTNDVPKDWTVKNKTPPKPIRPRVESKILNPSPGALVGARGPCGPKAT